MNACSILDRVTRAAAIGASLPCTPEQAMTPREPEYRPGIHALVAGLFDYIRLQQIFSVSALHTNAAFSRATGAATQAIGIPAIYCAGRLCLSGQNCLFLQNEANCRCPGFKLFRN